MSEGITSLKTEIEVLLNSTYEEGARHQGFTLDQLDGFLLHGDEFFTARPGHGCPSFEERGQALTELVKEGKLVIHMTHPSETIFDRPQS